MEFSFEHPDRREIDGKMGSGLQFSQERFGLNIWEKNSKLEEWFRIGKCWNRYPGKGSKQLEDVEFPRIFLWDLMKNRI